MASGTGLWAGSGISSRASPEFRFFRLLRGGGASVLAVAFRGGDDVAGGGALVDHFGRRIADGGTDARGRIGAAGGDQRGTFARAAGGGTAEHGKIGRAHV